MAVISGPFSFFLFFLDWLYTWMWDIVNTVLLNIWIFFLPVKRVELCFGWQAVKLLASQSDPLGACLQTFLDMFRVVFNQGVISSYYKDVTILGSLSISCSDCLTRSLHFGQLQPDYLQALHDPGKSLSLWNVQIYTFLELYIPLNSNLPAAWSERAR